MGEEGEIPRPASTTRRADAPEAPHAASFMMTVADEEEATDTATDTTIAVVTEAVPGIVIVAGIVTVTETVAVAGDHARTQSRGHGLGPELWAESWPDEERGDLVLQGSPGRMHAF